MNDLEIDLRGEDESIETTQLINGEIVVHETGNGEAWISGFVEVEA